MLSTLCLTLEVALLAGGVPPAVETPLIPGYEVLRQDVAISGQPSPQGLGRLGQMGFRTIVNLRTPAEGPADERGIIEAQGLRYVNIPVRGVVTPEAVRALHAVLSDPGAGPTLVHCASGRRARAAWRALLRSRSPGGNPASADSLN